MGNCCYGVPWSNLIGNDWLFVDIEYIPIGFCFPHPCDMQKAEILEFLNHVLMRQEKYSSLDQVFKFNKITSFRKRKSTIIDSQYNAAVETAPGDQPRKQTKKKAHSNQVLQGSEWTQCMKGHWRQVIPNRCKIKSSGILTQPLISERFQGPPWRVLYQPRTVKLSRPLITTQFLPPLWKLLLTPLNKQSWAPYCVLDHNPMIEQSPVNPEHYIN